MTNDTPPRVEGADDVLRAAEHILVGNVCTCGEWSAQCGNDVPRQWAEHLAAVPRPATQPEGTTVTEWGVRYGDGEIDFCGTHHSADALIKTTRTVISLPDQPHEAEDYEPMVLVSRQRTSYPDHVTDWEPADD